MTIAIGLLAEDGIVIAADSQITQPDYLKTRQAKILGGDREDAAMAVAGAGSVGYLESIKSDMIDAFLANSAKSIDQIESQAKTQVSAFYRDHIIPFAALPTVERPDISLLFGAMVNGESRLWATEKSVVRMCNKYEAIGSGASYASILLGQWYSPMKLEFARALAIFVILQVKECSEGCGKDTHLFWIKNNTVGCELVSQGAEIENAFRTYLELQAGGFRAVIGHEANYRPEIKEFKKMSKVFREYIKQAKLPDPQSTTNDQSPQPPSQESRGATNES